MRELLLNLFRDFYVHRGFFFPREGACLYSIPIERLAGSSLAGLPEITEKAAHHIVPVSAIPSADARVTYSYPTQKLPVEMTAAYAPGDVLDDYSVAYVTETDILSFVIFSAENHILDLHCAYADNPQAGKVCIALLRYNYERLMKEEPGRFTTFRITTVNSASDKLAQKLLAGCEPQVLHVCYTQKPLVRFTPVAPGFGGVLARTNALHDALITHGVSISLCMDPGALPYLIWSPREKLVIELSYTAENDTYTSFTFATQYTLNVNGEKFEQLSQAMYDDPGPALLVRDATERTATLIGVLEDGAIFQEEYTIDEFLVPFVDQVERLLEFLLPHSVFCEHRDERK